jgi:hypothetical protein
LFRHEINNAEFLPAEVHNAPAPDICPGQGGISKCSLRKGNHKKLSDPPTGIGMPKIGFWPVS